MALAGPETSSSGMFFGIFSVLLLPITFAIGIASLIVFVVWTIKYRTYKNASVHFIFSIIFQIMNIGYIAYYISMLL
jgi:hypothetical protein